MDMPIRTLLPLSLMALFIVLSSVNHYLYIARRTSGAWPLLIQAILIWALMYTGIYMVIGNYSEYACLRIVWPTILGIAAAYGMRRGRRMGNSKE